MDDHMGSDEAGTEATSEYHVAGTPLDAAGVDGWLADRLKMMSSDAPFSMTLTGEDHVSDESVPVVPVTLATVREAYTGLSPDGISEVQPDGGVSTFVSKS
jgi:hypothetical protein